jgi:hypothetical protein
MGTNLQSDTDYFGVVNVDERITLTILFIEMLHKETGWIFIAECEILSITKLRTTLIRINIWHFVNLMPISDVVMALHEAENFVYLTVY